MNQPSAYIYNPFKFTLVIEEFGQVIWMFNDMIPAWIAPDLMERE